MSWISKALHVANTVGGLAGKFMGSGGKIGNFANSVSKAAGLVTTFLPKAAPIINGALTAGKIIYKSGLADKITNGGATRFVQQVRNTFGLNKNPSAMNSIQNR